jgi:preprotein translocase subunit SecA
MFKSITSSLKKVFGTKYDRDVNNYMPIVEEINEIFETLKDLSNDELRNKTNEFRERIAEYLSNIDKDIADAKAEAEAEEDLLQKESIYDEIDGSGRGDHLEYGAL